ncbi:MAG: lipopolysaccharide biosynthesis protein [Endozoicomonas sp.]
MNNIRLFFKSHFLQQVSVLFLGTGLAQCITIASMPVLTRLYTPSQFGIYSVVFSVSSIFAVAVTLRYELSIVPADSDKKALGLFQLCVLATVIMGGLFILLSLMLPEDVFKHLGLNEIEGWFTVSLLMGAAYGIMAACTAWFNRQQAYNIIARGRIFLSLIAAVIALFLGALGHDDGLILGQFVSSAVVAMILVSFVKTGSLSNIKNVAREYSSAPKFLLPTALLDVISLQLPVIVISVYFTSEVAGQFGLAWKMLMLPVSFIGGAIGAVFFRRFSEALPNKEAARAILYKTWILLLSLGFFPTIVLLSFGSVIFEFFFGVEWVLAGEMVSVLAPMMLAVFVGSPTSVSYVSLGLQKYSLYFGLISISHRVLCLITGVLLDDFMLILWLMVVCEVVQILCYQLLALRKVR